MENKETPIPPQNAPGTLFVDATKTDQKVKAKTSSSTRLVRLREKEGEKKKKERKCCYMNISACGRAFVNLRR
jgi:hypothetical protein